VDRDNRTVDRAGGRTPARAEKSDFDFVTADWASPGRRDEGLRHAAIGTAFVLDLLVHIAVGLAVWNEFVHSPHPPWNPIMSGVLAGAAASFVHRTFIQRLFRTTLGKALFGLRLRQEDGSYPTLWQLIKQWLAGAFLTVAAPLQIFG
jgi:hypothetical protein